ncbi:MAG: 23S rRNA (uracil(1939)-C(5))-methyltransferase RlmD [Firmicutes bacterium]|nr:23S rRNA (uracil(1939)-C(5))-methyltransferase RlmD [Bacillota bacterium]MCL5993480.1 23S rRNA (uracil(1939)-C(5))-methyltransferase RlmD [Bacillota bacterium]
MANNHPPLVKGETIELAIESLNHEGEGVGRFRGFTVFVPNALPMEKITVKVISLHKNYARALLQSIATVSPQRVIPVCEQYEQCGGCQLQHIAYAVQLQLKQKTVEAALQRIAGLSMPVLPILGMEHPWHYRNKAQVPIGQQKNRIVAGFYEKRSHNIVELKCCHIQHQANDAVIHTVRNILQTLGITAYQEKEHQGLVRHVLARTSFATGETLVVIVANGTALPKQELFCNALREAIPNLCGIVQNVNTRRGNTILGKEDITLWGRPWLREKLEDLEFHVSPRSFFQVNPSQTSRLYQKALEYAALSGQETVFDLYCGIGTISLFLARSAAKVIGVESLAAAVEDARKNASINNISNATFYVGAAETVVPSLYKKGFRADVVVVDPPRKGCDQVLLETIIKMSPQRVVYVSCNPATLARDIKFLAENGFNPVEAQPVDMFPHTNHVETVVLISASSKAGKC